MTSRPPTWSYVQLARAAFSLAREDEQPGPRLTPQAWQAIGFAALAELEAWHRPGAHRGRGRPPQSHDGARRELLDQVLPIAEDCWRELTTGAPTLGMVAERTSYSMGGLKKALGRVGLRWGEVREMARRRNKWDFLSLEAGESRTHAECG